MLCGPSPPNEFSRYHKEFLLLFDHHPISILVNGLNSSKDFGGFSPPAISFLCFLSYRFRILAQKFLTPPSCATISLVFFPPLIFQFDLNYECTPSFVALDTPVTQNFTVYLLLHEWRRPFHTSRFLLPSGNAQVGVRPTMTFFLAPFDFLCCSDRVLLSLSRS